MEGGELAQEETVAFQHLDDHEALVEGESPVQAERQLGPHAVLQLEPHFDGHDDHYLADLVESELVDVVQLCIPGAG